MSQKKFISFGFRCSSAAILKKLQLKHESYPFDWLISRPHVIRHCIEDNFQQFLDQENYQRKYTNTYEMADSTNGFVCDEHLMVNTFFQPTDQLDVENTYKYHLAMNHHNITEQKDYEYYQRCISRFRELISSQDDKIYVHIGQLITSNAFFYEEDTILDEIKEFDDFVFNSFQQKIKGIVFLLVKTGDDTPRRELLHVSEKTGTQIFVLFTNKHFVDAGEIFMGTCHGEIQSMEEIIKASIQ